MANTLKLGNGNWATKEDSLLAYNDENGNFKPLPFDFTRASSATVVNKDGLIETVGSGKARIDFGSDSKGALLLEPSRTNLATYSEKLSNWTQDGTTTLDDNIVSPDGTLNASKITFNSGNERVYTFANTSIGSFSAYFKGVQGKKVKLRDNSGASFTEITLTDNWVRYYLYKETSNTNIQIQNIDADDVNVWGAQIEEGSYATSYIPTQGSAVTRVEDSINQTVPSGIIGQTEGVVYMSFLSVNNFDGSSGVLFEMKQDSNNRINIYFSSGTPRLFGVENSNGLFNQSLSLNTDSTCKLAVKYNSTSTKVFINGSLIHTLSGISNIAFSDFNILPNNNINYNEIKLYNTALTDAELQVLTTI
jgi:hypothetical protein